MHGVRAGDLQYLRIDLYAEERICLVHRRHSFGNASFQLPLHLCRHGCLTKLSGEAIPWWVLLIRHRLLTLTKQDGLAGMTFQTRSLSRLVTGNHVG